MGAAAGKLGTPATTRSVREQGKNHRQAGSSSRARRSVRKKNNMRIGYVNCTGFKGKIAEIAEVAESEKMDIIALVETHIIKAEMGIVTGPAGYDITGKGRERGQKREEE